MKTQILILILVLFTTVLFAQNNPAAPVPPVVPVSPAAPAASTAPAAPVSPVIPATRPSAPTLAESLDSLNDKNVQEPFDSLSDQPVKEIPDSLVTESPESGEPAESEKTDTVHIRVGSHAIEIISKDKKTHIDVDKLDDWESQWDDNDWENHQHIETIHHCRNKKFDGHWASFDFGINQLLNTSYPKSIYPEGTPLFLTTAPEKSFEVNINLLEYSFGFSSHFGMVTGLGFNFNDYKFKNRYTLTKDEKGVIQPADIPEGDFRLSKLSTTFIDAPLMLEVQIPKQFASKKMFIAAGVIGGVKIHQHIKTQVGDEKKRDNGDFNITPFRWGYTARIGFEDVGIFATYYNTKLFKEGLGPTTTPATIGITLTF